MTNKQTPIIFWDLLLIGIGVFGLASLILSGYGQIYPVLRFLLAIPILFFCPGYLLYSFLFTGNELQVFERSGLILIFSFSIITFICLAIGWMGLPLNHSVFLYSIAAFILVLLISCVIRRWQLNAKLRSEKTLKSTPPYHVSFSKVSVIVTGILLISGMFAIAYRFSKSQSGENYTQMYILEPNTGKADISLRTGSNTYRFILFVENQENMPRDYQLQVSVDGIEAGLPLPTLDHGEKWAKIIEVPLPGEEKTHEIQIELYTPGQNTPYRELHLWVNEDLKQIVK